MLSSYYNYQYVHPDILITEMELRRSTGEAAQIVAYKGFVYDVTDCLNGGWRC
jgi:hypothetical protein